MQPDPLQTTPRTAPREVELAPSLTRSGSATERGAVPGAVQFEHLGYFEHLMIRKGSGWKDAGTILLPLELPPAYQGRAIGSVGEIERVLTIDTEVHRGHKFATIKASPKRPIIVRSILFPLQGKRLS